MKTILYMAVTANGMIAKKNNDTPWSEEEFASYTGKVKEAGAFIVGNKTLPLFRESDFAAMGHPLTVVLTKGAHKSTDKIKYVNSSQEAYSILEKAGFETALVTGGAETNTVFAKFIDEIHLDIEPFIWGEGIPLFSPANFEYKLELIDSKKLNENTIQLHYRVLK